jgi:hypothetical protein
MIKTKTIGSKLIYSPSPLQRNQKLASNVLMTLLVITSLLIVIAQFISSYQITLK